ncbi:MAG: hypothetical protein DME23_15360 [Verrucomicrobia bacterium]|nr:MAG: hypothetical protein DME23_15360 [Verrucomicrobiota bacterium]
MPTARAGLAAVAVGGKIYAIGGFNNGGTRSDVAEYDPASDTWTTKAPMPAGRVDFAAGAVAGKIYAIGGFSGSVFFPGLNVVEEYDAASNTWTTKAPMPTARQNLVPG